MGGRLLISFCPFLRHELGLFLFWGWCGACSVSPSFSPRVSTGWLRAWVNRPLHTANRVKWQREGEDAGRQRRYLLTCAPLSELQGAPPLLGQSYGTGPCSSSEWTVKMTAAGFQGRECLPEDPQILRIILCSKVSSSALLKSAKYQFA